MSISRGVHRVLVHSRASVHVEAEIEREFEIEEGLAEHEASRDEYLGCLGNRHIYRCRASGITYEGAAP